MRSKGATGSRRPPKHTAHLISTRLSARAKHTARDTQHNATQRSPLSSNVAISHRLCACSLRHLEPARRGLVLITRLRALGWPPLERILWTLANKAARPTALGRLLRAAIEKLAPPLVGGGRHFRRQRRRAPLMPAARENATMATMGRGNNESLWLYKGIRARILLPAARWPGGRPWSPLACRWAGGGSSGRCQSRESRN